MLKSISTTQFITSFIAVSCIYYAVVLIRYYRKEILAFWSGQSKKQVSSDAKAGAGPVIVPGKAGGPKDGTTSD